VRAKILEGYRRVVPPGLGLPLLFTLGLVAVIISVQCQRPAILETRPAPTGSEAQVRVLLSLAGLDGSVEISAPSGLRLRADGEERMASSPLRVTAVEGGLRVGHGTSRVERIEVTSLGGEPLRTGARAYRGTLVLSAESSHALRVVNTVSMPDYLRGVLGGEMPSSWPLEALKCQAVAARTYVVARKQTRTKAPFDVYDDTRSQVYVGVPNTGATALCKAVEETSGLVLAFEGSVLTAFFHSTCGGRTADVEEVFGKGGAAPLQGVLCGNCQDSKYYRWSTVFTAKDLSRLLGLSGVTSIVLMEKTPSGRCREVTVRHARGETRLTGTALRQALGPEALRSTAFSVEPQDGGSRFQGSGWGHGVGMCQWGARGLARKGVGFAEILAHYYPQSELLPLSTFD
jgi:stage II sporulation protein D